MAVFLGATALLSHRQELVVRSAPACPATWPGISPRSDDRHWLHGWSKQALCRHRPTELSCVKCGPDEWGGYDCSNMIMLSTQAACMRWDAHPTALWPAAALCAVADSHGCKSAGISPQAAAASRLPCVSTFVCIQTAHWPYLLDLGVGSPWPSAPKKGGRASHQGRCLRGATVIGVCRVRVAPEE